MFRTASIQQRANVSNGIIRNLGEHELHHGGVPVAVRQLLLKMKDVTLQCKETFCRSKFYKRTYCSRHETPRQSHLSYTSLMETSLHCGQVPLSLGDTLFGSTISSTRHSLSLHVAHCCTMQMVCMLFPNGVHRDFLRVYHELPYFRLSINPNKPLVLLDTAYF